MKTPQVPPLAGMTPLGLSGGMKAKRMSSIAAEKANAAKGNHITSLELEGGKSQSLAQRRANAPLRPAKEQAPCDHGLFGDERNQADLVDLARKHGG
jgi:hypothetical protein